MFRIDRVVVTGGRNFNDGGRIEADIRALIARGLGRVAQGGHNVPKRPGPAPRRPERSADALAWWSARALSMVVSTRWADWETHGKGAGYRRNTEMLDEEVLLAMASPSHENIAVLAYPDPNSRGTWHCVREALRRQLPVAIWHPHCNSADLLDPRNTHGVIDGHDMLRVVASPSRTLYVSANPQARREWSDFFGLLG